MTAGGTVIVTGSTGAAGRQQPYLALAPPGQAARAVPFATIPGATISQVSVDAVAVSGNRRVAVGEAGGSPAIWTATGSSWSSASGGLAPVPPTTPAPAAPTPPVPAAAGSGLTGFSAPPAAGTHGGTYAGAQKLTSVVHGPAGWLATGETVSATARRPLLLTSADGTVWNASPQNGGSPLRGRRS